MEATVRKIGNISVKVITNEATTDKDAKEEANKNPLHSKATYREPDELIVIYATVPMAYTTENGVRVIPIGCLHG